ncbi:unnamed protein product [Gadus morhua 'NCC']
MLRETRCADARHPLQPSVEEEETEFDPAEVTGAVSWVAGASAPGLGRGRRNQRDAGSMELVGGGGPSAAVSPSAGASAWAAEGPSWGLIWPSWRKQAIRVQLVQTEVKVTPQVREEQRGATEEQQAGTAPDRSPAGIRPPT